MSQLNVRALANENLPRLNPLLLPLPWLAVLVLVIVFIAVKYNTDTQDNLNTQGDTKEFPQIFMTDVTLREFNAAGTLHYQLQTPLVRHYQMGEGSNTGNYTLFELPQIVFLGDVKKPAWYITAQQGRSDDNDNLLTFINNVLAQQTSASQGTLSINTTELRVNTKEQFAETDKAVTMRSAKGNIETLGMRADIKQDRIELLSHVKGIYEP